MNSVPRYTPTTCFETFPFPFPDDLVLTPKYAPDPPRPPIHPGLTPDQTYANAAHFYSLNEAAPAYRTAPQSSVDHRAAIAAAAQELNELRENWLNPPEWTETRPLEFPGSVNGPWARYVDPATVNAQTGVGTVRYPRLEPKDAECAAKLKKRTLTNLYNERPAWLAHAHAKLDAAGAAAYGFLADLTDEQILERLLALNLARATEEANTANISNSKPAKKAQREKSADELVQPLNRCLDHGGISHNGLPMPKTTLRPRKPASGYDWTKDLAALPAAPRRKATAVPTVIEHYDVAADAKSRISLRRSKTKYFHVQALSDGSYLLQPRVLVPPTAISSKTRRMLEASVENLKAGKASPPIDLTPFFKD